jgi:RND family efflux transporter MFP subunit
LRRRLPQLARRTAAPPAAATDAHLLARWAVGRDEAAFELLVRRHGPMVLAVCRRALADPNDADDAFQATFLVLARKAGSVSRGEALAAWLHRVAVRAASRVRADRLRRTGREEGGVEVLPGTPEPDPAWAELSRVLDEEVDRLPARHRAAFVLCCLEGKTGEEAARVLGCPAGTVSSRLTRARERLRDRLARRGFAPATFALAALAERAPAAPASALIDSTLRVALAFATGWPSPVPPARPAAVAEGVIRTMILTKLRLVPALLVAGLLAAGAVFAGGNPAPSQDDPLPKANAKADEASPVPLVTLVRPQKGGLDRVSRQACSAEPAQQADLFPGVAGRLSRTHVTMGDRVKAGQLLAEIEAPGLTLDMDQAKVGVEQAEGLLREAEARLTTVKVEVEAGRGLTTQREADAAAAKAMLTLREKQYDRVKSLAKTGVVGNDTLAEHESQVLTAQAQVQAAAAAVENARAEMELRRGKVTLAEAAIGTARANVSAAKVAVRKADLALAQTRVVSPIDGVVTREFHRTGEFVLAGGAPQPLFTVVRPDMLRVVIEVPGHDVRAVEPGLPVELTFHTLPEEKFTGKVARVGFAVNPRTGTMRAEVDLPNPGAKLRPGMVGVAAFKVGKGSADAVRLPVKAIAGAIPSAGMCTVYVYRDGKARATRVRLDYLDRGMGMVEIGSGLTPDDQVVLDPSRLSGDEVPVRVAPPK